MSKSSPRVRDARFRDRPSKGPTPPRASSPSGAPRSSIPAKESSGGPSPSNPKAPWWRSGDVVIPLVLAAGVTVAGWYFYREKNPPPAPVPATTADAGTSPAADAGAAEPPSAPAAAPTPAPAPAPAADGDRGLDGSPREPRTREPTSPDPTNGRFTMAQATEGLAGTGPLTAVIETSRGDFTCTLLEREAPVTVANFVGLARGRRPFWDPVAAEWARRPFYDGSIFHRVIPGFMIQGGDQLRSGTGDTGYTIVDENVRPHNAGGQLCMANRGPGTGSSQFFITEVARDHLDGTYSIFGNCTPASLVQTITGVPRNGSDRPDQPVFIRHVRVSRGG